MAESEPEGQWAGAGITLRVSRDGGRTWGPRIAYWPARDAAPLQSGGRFPPCACPTCRSVK